MLHIILIKILYAGACNKTFAFNEVTAGRHRIVNVTSADLHTSTEMNFYTCRKNIIMQ